MQTPRYDLIMKTYSITLLAREFDLSRSTLLYYDRIGLLCASTRTTAGYRQYSSKDRNRLERICIFRKAGLSLSDIYRMLSDDAAPSVKILEKRLQELEEEILALRNQQHSITAMLKKMTKSQIDSVINKKMWVEMLESAGMNEVAMRRWHSEFESRAPQAHHVFLLSLGISEAEVDGIRQWSRKLDRVSTNKASGES